ncbi:hypothetical protein E4U13_002459 [Claviceps humidiphila]|uniref:Uncharacterized protein n=1 Tax=Claviceps humidiphila TaxID=1294629 RepID=A0A9P7Q027_9HYPO|nr:hypothetical protein E4U13_002459 [Claviceps humidiphila]
MRFTLLLGISAAVSALPLDGRGKSLRSDSASTGPKLPLYRIVDEVSKNQVRAGDGEVLERSPLTGPKLPLYQVFDEVHENQVRDGFGEILERSPLTGPKLPLYHKFDNPREN